MRAQDHTDSCQFLCHLADTAGLCLQPPDSFPCSLRSSSVFMERELTLDGAVVSASFDSGMDMGVVGTTAGTIWYISWTEGTSTRLISGHRTKVSSLDREGRQDCQPRQGRLGQQTHLLPPSLPPQSSCLQLMSNTRRLKWGLLGPGIVFTSID